MSRCSLPARVQGGRRPRPAASKASRRRSGPAIRSPSLERGQEIDPSTSSMVKNQVCPSETSS